MDFYLVLTLAVDGNQNVIAVQLADHASELVFIDGVAYEEDVIEEATGKMHVFRDVRLLAEEVIDVCEHLLSMAEMGVL